MISKHDGLRKHEIGTEFLKSKDHSHELFLSRGVVLLGIIEGLASIIDGVEMLILSLSQNSPDCIITSVTHELKRQAPVGGYKYGSGH